MSTELSIIDKIDDPQGFVIGIGSMFAESGMFGCKTKAQGIVLALHVAMTRQSPLALMQDYHFIEGKLSMKSEAMLRRFSQRGGKFFWVKDGRDGRAEIRFEKDGSALLSVYTREDAIKAELIGGKNPNWRLREANMLRSRAVSDGLRMFDPESTGGAYTEDELADFGVAPTDAIEGEVVQPVAAAAQSVEAAKTRTRKAKEPASPAATETTSTVAPVQADPEGVASTTSDSTAGGSTEAAAVTTPAVTTTEATTPQLPQSVIDIIQLRDYVGPRWNPANKSGPWETVWGVTIPKAMNLPHGENDEEVFTKANDMQRQKVTKWLNDMRVNVDKLATSKDLNTWANQSPQPTT